MTNKGFLLPVLAAINVAVGSKMATTTATTTHKSGGRVGSAEASPIPHTRIEDEKHMTAIYSIGQKLGEGSFGLVKEVMHLDTGTRWACKAVNKERVRSLS